MKLKTTRARVLLSKLKKRPRRINPGTREKLIDLARSWLDDPIHDIIVRASDMAIADGHSRVEGLELIGETEADVTLLQGDISDLALDRMAFVTAYHRSPLGSYDQACIIRSMKEAEPGVTNKSLADEMHIDPSMPTMLLSLFDCPDEVQQAAREAKIGVSIWYTISKSADQLAALNAALNGSSRKDLQGENRKNSNGNVKPASSPSNGHASKAPTPWDKLPKINIRLANKSAPSTVTVATGNADDYDHILAVLNEAVKAVNYAKEQKCTVKNAPALWSDRAIAAIEAKPPKAKPERNDAHPAPQPAA
jgi:hypothetical protein